MRMPRIIGALLIGGALGMAGAAFQGMFRYGVEVWHERAVRAGRSADCCVVPLG